MKSKPRNYWTKEKCHEIALLCKTRKEFFKKYKSTYVISCRNKWLSEICDHMISFTKPMYYWTKEKCHEEALKYDNRSDFGKYGGRGYRAAYENGWLDDICSHMNLYGNIFNRLIYLIEFDDKFVYIGLTCNVERRFIEHIKTDKKSSVYKHILKTNSLPKIRILTDYVDAEIASKIEMEYIKKYEEDGYKLLNKDNGGGLGGGRIKWTYENCKKEASNYLTRKAFYKYKRRAYEKSRDNNWLNDFY